MTQLHLAIALQDAGWHPAAWREADADPSALLSPRRWVALAQEAERGLLDLLTIEDGLGLQSAHPFRPDTRTDEVRGRLDAVLVASRIGPATSHIGILPTAVTTHTEPFHVSKAIATLDYVTRGRAGVRVQVDLRPETAAHFGRRELEPIPDDVLSDPEALGEAISDAFDEAADHVQVQRLLWDSWEDDAEIRDVATGRFIDRDKVHHIDFEGRWFSVKGPSITPRPPQGQPVVAALGHATVPYRLIGRSADLGFVTPHDADDAARIVGAVRAEQEAAGRADETVHVLADLVVVLDDTEQAAQDRLARLDELAGRPLQSDAEIYVGTPAGLADLLLDWQSSGLSGYRLRPATLPHDLVQVTQGLVPELQRRGAFRTAYEADTLRGLLGLPLPTNRFAAARS